MEASTVSRRRENTRARLLEAAFEVFAETGFDGTSVEAICERAGFTRGAFYSNFSSKDELFLQLARTFAEGKLERVSARVRELESEGMPRLDPARIVEEVLDLTSEERIGTLLMSEIRTNAMRDPRLAEAYVAWHDAMIERVARIVEDIATAYRLNVRVPLAEAARLLISNWESAAIDAAMAGLDDDATRALCSSRTSFLASALVDTPA